MVKQIIIGTAVVCTVGFVGLTIYNYNHNTPAPPRQLAKTLDLDEVSALINAERVRAGEAPLERDSRLDASAAAKCQDMRINSYAQHDTPTGTRWQDFFYPEFRNLAIAENLEENIENPQNTVTGWMNSPEHKASILNADYNHVGYAFCGASKTLLFNNAIVQHFAQE